MVLMTPNPKADASADGVLLRVHDLYRAFGGLTVLNGVSLELRRGEVVLLRGDNGSGKTTLLNILTGGLEPDAGVIELYAGGNSERFAFPRRWWQDLNLFDHFTPERIAGENVGRTWQDLRLFATQDLRSNIAVAAPGQMGENPVWAVFRWPAVRRQEAANLAAADAMLGELGLGDRATSSADRVSLGQSKRVAIARAVQAGARILFLDEPFSGLDAAGVKQVLGLLESLVAAQGVTLVIVEHVFHIPLLLARATMVWTLAGGRLTVQSPAEVREELRRAPTDGLREWLTRFAASAGGLVEQPLPGGAILSTIVPSGTGFGKPLLEIEGLVVRRGNRLVIGREEGGRIDGLSLALREGELAVLQAPNGWGKTTFLEAVAGLLPIEAGEIRLRGQRLNGLPVWERARLGCSLLRARDQTFPNLTVKEALRLGGTAEAEALRPFMGRRVIDLSGGERQRVALQIALRPAQALPLLDEPFGMLDEAAIRQLSQAFLPAAGRATLIAVPGALELP